MEFGDDELVARVGVEGGVHEAAGFFIAEGLNELSRGESGVIDCVNISIELYEQSNDIMISRQNGTMQRGVSLLSSSPQNVLPKLGTGVVYSHLDICELFVSDSIPNRK